MSKLDFKQISIAYAAASFASITTAGIGGMLYEHLGGNTDYSLVIGGCWLLTTGIPSCLVSMDKLRSTLGEKSQTTVKAIGGHQSGRRAIPFSANGKQSHVFLSQIPWLKNDNQPEYEQVELPQAFTVSIDDSSHSVTIDEIETFLKTAWRRQRTGENGLSRHWWTRQHRPRLRRLEYDTRLNVLLSVNGLILDRAKRKSGRLSVPPMTAIKALQGQFLLG